jgi:glycosyltransferase involved in cell wall biosynthesis
MADPLPAASAPLTNAVEPEPPSARAPNDYARRRAAMIAMLSRCDAVLAVSAFVREKFVSLGVDESVVRTMHIGSRVSSLAPVRHPARGEGGPVRLLFLGYNNYYKGLPMLADALEALPDRVLARLSLSMHVMGARSARRRFRGLARRLAGLHVREGYRFEEIPRLCAGHDAGLVTSVWWDNGPQTVFEFLTCGLPVIGAAVGGIPDFVRDGENGLLFRGNDRVDLARVLTRVTEDPALLPRLRAGVRPTKSMEFHAAEIVRLYESLGMERGEPVVQVVATATGRVA